MGHQTYDLHTSAEIARGSTWSWKLAWTSSTFCKYSSSCNKITCLVFPISCVLFKSLTWNVSNLDLNLIFIFKVFGSLYVCSLIDLNRFYIGALGSKSWKRDKRRIERYVTSLIVSECI